jgi:hypothetical protein
MRTIAVPDGLFQRAGEDLDESFCGVSLRARERTGGAAGWLGRRQGMKVQEMRRLIASCRWVIVFGAALVLLFAAPRHTLGRSCFVVARTVTIAGAAVAATGTVCSQLNGRLAIARWPVREHLASLE